MISLTPFIAIGVITLLAAMSPGPDFAVVAKNSLIGSRKVGFATALGVELGIWVHLTYILAGVGLVVSKSIVLFSIIKYLGALYLLYLGAKLLLAKKESSEPHEALQIDELTPWAAFREGFFTNVLNPKATLFFLSIFTQIVEPSTPFFVQLLIGVEVAVVVGVWFMLLSLLITYGPVKGVFKKVHHYVMKVMGGALILFGIKLAVATNQQ
jgi:RhtB (resistance to homoserine/threonine) family protein